MTWLTYFNTPINFSITTGYLEFNDWIIFSKIFIIIVFNLNRHMLLYQIWLTQFLSALTMAQYSVIAHWALIRVHLVLQISDYKLHNVVCLLICSARPCHMAKWKHTYLCFFLYSICELCFFKPSGVHPLFHSLLLAWGHRGWVWWIKTGLYQSLATFTGNHGLKFSCSKSVDMSCLTCNQQHHLGTS